MSVSGSISRKRVGSLSQRTESPLPPLDIQSIQMPSNPQNALALKTAALGTNRSLYQTCSHLRKRLRWVEDFLPFLEQPPTAEPLDVVSHMVHLLRLGSPLCHLYNLLIPSFMSPNSSLFVPGLKPPNQIEYDFPQFYDSPDGQGVKNWAKQPQNAKMCQKYLAMFCMAMKQRKEEGRWDLEIWALHELWGKSNGTDGEIDSYDSTGLMKVLTTVEGILDNLPSNAISQSPSTPHTASTSHGGGFGSYGGHLTRASDIPFSLGGTASGATAVKSLAATMNGGVHIDSDYIPNNASTTSFATTASSAEDMQRSKSTADANAFKSVDELVQSEKSYVNELEILVRCSQELVSCQIISTEKCHQIFSNLSKILDFHRKFLIKLETEYEPIEEDESHQTGAWAKGRWGQPFVSSESEFDCYGPYCANYLDAIQVVNEQMPILLRAQNLPSSERPCLHPERELQAFMIKPIQRITKYQLLLDAILKTSAKHDYPYRTELEDAAAAVRRIAAGINEVTDFKAKQATVRELNDRVEDWKGHDVEKFGDLYLDDHFTVTKADQPREYHVFLFEKMMLCCKEVLPDRKEKKSKSSLRKDKGKSQPGNEKKKLALKGRIFVSNINRATIGYTPDVPFGAKLTIAWTVPHRHPSGYSEDVEDWFIMTGKTEDTLKKWAEKVIELAEADRKRQDEYRTERARQSGRMSASSQFQNSHFAPPTPATDLPPFGFPPPLPDDDDDSYKSGRTTPSMGGSMHYPSGPGPSRRAQSQQGVPAQYQAELRARAMTEDQFGPSMSQWRQQNAMPPPLPRLSSTTSAMSEASFGMPSSRPSLGRQMSSASRLGPAEEVDEDDMTQTYSNQLPRHRSTSSPNVYPEMPYNSAATLAGGTAYFTKRMSGLDGKRSSGESHSTETSETSSGQSPSTPYAHVVGDLRGPTPVSRQNSGDGSAVLIRVRCGDCQFSLGIPSDVTYPTLHQKIAKKIRLFRGSEPGTLNLKWLDADGDEVSIKCDADIENMFDEVREMGMNHVNLIAR